MGESGATPELKGDDLSIAIIVARYNEDICRRLLRGAVNALNERAVPEPDVFWVPGSMEIPVMALTLAEKGTYDAIICLGCVIKGETHHFEVIAESVGAGIMQVQLDTGVPVAFGVLTTYDREQALARSGPKQNKGAEAAETAVEMANLLREIQS